MPEKRETVRIAKRVVDAASPSEALYRLWDSELKGFGLRVTPTGAKSYFVYYRAGGGRSGAQKEFTIGRHGVLTPDQARKEAERLLSAARLGGDPQGDRAKARADLTVAELCDRYLAEGVGTKKASTLTADRSRIEAHIKPLLGRRRLSSLWRVVCDQPFAVPKPAGKARGHSPMFCVRSRAGVEGLWHDVARAQGRGHAYRPVRSAAEDFRLPPWVASRTRRG